ncbi:MAG: TonB-dependent receptor [Sideroxyarcus sp.]|nr:TonB-dependent receptor [Sideroxyarcus sp.]
MNKKLFAMSALPLVLSISFANQANAEDAAVVAPDMAAETVVPVVAAPSADEVKIIETEKAKAPQMLGDVVVSASKILQSTKEAPSAVAVITSAELEKGNNQRVGDALIAAVPSFYNRGGALRGSKGGAGNNMSMRGQGGSLKKIVFIVDGINMVDAYSGEVNFSAVSMDDIERIEVVPGVGSALYGSNAMGGVVSIITKAPTKKEVVIKSGSGYGDAAGLYSSVSYRDKFESGLGIVFGVFRNIRDGYVSDYVTKTPTGVATTQPVASGAIATTTYTGSPTYIVGDKGLNASTERNVNTKLYFDLSPTARIFAGVSYADDSYENQRYNSYLTNAATGAAIPVLNAATSLNLNGGVTSIKESDFFGSGPGGHTSLRYFAGYDGEVLDGKKLSLNIGTMEREQWSSSAGATATLASGTGTLSTAPNSTTNASAQISLPVGDSQFLIVGVAHEAAILHQKKYSLSNWQDIDSKSGVLDYIDAKSTINSLFMQDQVAVGDKLTIYAGGRYDAWKAGGTGVVITGSYPGTFVYPDRTASAFNPKLAGVYQFTDQLVLKSSVGTGFRAATNYYLFANPTFDGRAAPNGTMVYSNPNLKPERNTSYDLTAEFYFRQGGNVKTTYYITKSTNLISQRITKVPTYTDTVINKVVDYTSQQDNVGEALARGIELSGEYPLVSWLNVSAAYTYNDARITKDASNAGLEGKRVTNVPKNMASLAFDAKNGDWSGKLSARYVGETFSQVKNTDVIHDVYTGNSIYTVADLKVGYQVTKELKLNVMVDNLFDKQYYQYSRMPGRSFVTEIAGKL